MTFLRLFSLLILFLTISTTTFSQGRIDFQGRTNQGEGAVAYPMNGHRVPANLVAGAPVNAYTSIQSVDEDPQNYVANARAGAHFTNIANGFPALSGVLQQNANLSLSNLRISFTRMTLGQDVQGQDWMVNGNVETRHYQNGTVKIKYGNTLIATGQVPRFTIDIDYRNTGVNGDEEISGRTDFLALQFQNGLNGDAALVANALSQDLSNCRIKFVYEAMDAAVQLPSHGVYEAERGHLLRENCPVQNNNNNNNANNNNNNQNRGLSGMWYNTDPSKGIVALKFGGNDLRRTVQAWGKCSPRPCDWGTTPVQSAGRGTYSATFSSQVATRKLSMKMISTYKLQVTAVYYYKDKKRKPLKQSFTFTRKKPKGFTPYTFK